MSFAALFRARPAAGAPKRAAVMAVCVPLVAGFEGLRQYAYRDPVGIPTVCFGETKGIRMGMSFTRAECEGMLSTRLAEFVDGVERCATREMPVEVTAAFGSLSYNIGVGSAASGKGACGSTAMRLWNAGDGRGACDALLRFRYARGGIPLPGLTIRREKERALCLKGAA